MLQRKRCVPFAGPRMLVVVSRCAPFQIAANFSLDFAPSSAAMGDFNGDGDSDLAVAGSTNLSVFLGKDGGRPAEKRGKPRRLELTDILCAAPYNRQVRRLQEALPSDARIGSVDKVLRPRKLRSFLCPGGTIENRPIVAIIGPEVAIGALQDRLLLIIWAAWERPLEMTVCRSLEFPHASLLSHMRQKTGTAILCNVRVELVGVRRRRTVGEPFVDFPGPCYSAPTTDVMPRTCSCVCAEKTLRSSSVNKCNLRMIANCKTAVERRKSSNARAMSRSRFLSSL